MYMRKLTILKTLRAWALSFGLFSGISSASFRNENNAFAAGAISRILNQNTHKFWISELGIPTSEAGIKNRGRKIFYRKIKNELTMWRNGDRDEECFASWVPMTPSPELLPFHRNPFFLVFSVFVSLSVLSV